MVVISITFEDLMRPMAKMSATNCLTNHQLAQMYQPKQSWGSLNPVPFAQGRGSHACSYTSYLY